MTFFLPWKWASILHRGKRSPAKIYYAQMRFCRVCWELFCFTLVLLPVIPRCLWLQTRIQPHAFLPPILVLFCSLWTNRAHREQNSARGKNLIWWISNAIRLRKMCERATKVIKDSESAHSRQAVRVSRFTIRTEMFGTACDGEMKEGQRGNKSKKAAATDILNVFQVYSNKRGFSLHGHCRCVRSQTCILAMTLILSQR